MTTPPTEKTTITLTEYGSAVTLPISMTFIQQQYNKLIEHMLYAYNHHVAQHTEKVDGCEYCYPPAKVPLTRKQKMRIQWNQFKYQLGMPFLKVANRLGAYNETDDWYD